MYYFCVVSCQKQILFVVVCISSLKHCTHGPLKKKFHVAELTATTMFGGGSATDAVMTAPHGDLCLFMVLLTKCL